MGRVLTVIGGAWAALMFATSASADPCEAIPEAGPLPAYLSFGATFSGPVVEVIDGDSLCVAVGPTPQEWVEVRAADFYAPELATPAGRAAKAALEHLVRGKEAVCVANMRTYDRIAARCRVNGQPIGTLMRAAGIGEGGAGARQRAALPGQQRRPAAAASSSLTCAELRARGGARRGEPGYRSEWDGDGDGIACEPYRRR